MMALFASAQRALPITFVVYMLQALLASFVALPVGVELLALVPQALADDSGAALLFDSVERVGSLLRAARLELVIAIATMLLLGPWLQMAWFVALERPTSTAEALVEGAQRVVRAWLVSAAVATAFVLLALPIAAVAYFLHDFFALRGDARSHDLALSLALLPLLPLAFVSYVLHDLARACALSTPALRSVRCSVRASLQPRVLAAALLVATLGAALLGLAQWAAGALSHGRLALLAGTATLQLSLLARAYLRSLWLACAIARAEPLPSAAYRSESGGGARAPVHRRKEDEG
jgi:hypothetical protein